MSSNSLVVKHKLPTLNDAANYQRWLNSTQDHTFAMFKTLEKNHRSSYIVECLKYNRAFYILLKEHKINRVFEKNGVNLIEHPEF